LDDCRSTAIVGLTDEYVGLRSLSIINVGLTSLKGFPALPLLVFVSSDTELKLYNLSFVLFVIIIFSWMSVKIEFPIVFKTSVVVLTSNH